MKALRIGATTMFHREQPVSLALESLARSGYSAAEIWVEHLQQSGEAPRALARQAEALDLALTVHAASYDLNPTSSNRGIARESQRQVEASLAIAAELEAEVIVVHPGRRTSSRDEAETFWPRLLDWLAEVDAAAARTGMHVGLELMEKRPKEIFMVPADAALLMATSWQQIGLTIDVAHMNTHGDPLWFLQQLEPDWILHVHLSDNAPRQTHLPLGEGEIDIPTVLSALSQDYDGIISLEGYSPGRGDALLAQNMAYLRQAGVV